MSKTNYEIPFNSPITEMQHKAAFQDQQAISLPWQQWAGNMGTAMNTVQTASQAMTTLDPTTATVSDMVTAWEAFRVALQGIT